MTIHLDWLKNGRAPRGTPPRGGRPRRILALGLIAGLALIQAGCTSGPFSNCGSCNSCGFFRRTTSRILNRPSGCCGSTVAADSGVEYSAPSTVVGPPTTVGPISPGTTSVPSTVPPVDTPTNLNEIPPSAGPGRSPTGSTSGAGATRSSYIRSSSATQTALRLESGGATDRSSVARPARRRTSQAASEATSVDDDNPLDHLPPFPLPGDVTDSRSGSPTPSASRPEGKAGEGPVRGAPGSTASKETEEGIRLLPEETTAEPEAPAAAGIGIARFAPVDPKLAGGSVPNSAGLAWLAEKGYRTVLDLRPSGEVAPEFIAEAAAKGLRYVALPVNLDRLDADRLARFQFELAAPEARPLFFFDSDGARAGALWYIRRVTVDRVDAQIARREAEEIGLKDKSAWQVTTLYLDRIEAARVHPGTSPTAASAPRADGNGPSAVEPTEIRLAPRPDNPSQAQASSDGASPAFDPSIFQPRKLETGKPAGSTPPSLPYQSSPNWRPLAAMLLTGLSLPLAYWSRTVIPDAIARARASLPAPAPRPRSLPDESGE